MRQDKVIFIGGQAWTGEAEINRSTDQLIPGCLYFQLGSTHLQNPTLTPGYTLCVMWQHTFNCYMMPSSEGQGQVKTTSLPGTSLLQVEGWLLQGWVASCSLNDYLMGLGTEEARPPHVMPSCQSAGNEKKSWQNIINIATWYAVYMNGYSRSASIKHPYLVLY